MFDSVSGLEAAAVVAATEVADLPSADLVDFIAATHRLLAWAHSRQLAGVAELAWRRPEPGSAGRAGQVDEFVGAELSAALRLSRRAGDVLVATAWALERLPGTRQALAAGRIDLPKARVIGEGTTDLSDQEAAAVERQVLLRAGGQTLSMLKQSLNRAVLALAPAREAARRQSAYDARRTELVHGGDGISSFSIFAPTPQVLRLYAAVDATARTLDPALGTLDQRRADATDLLARRVLDDPALPATRFGRPGVVLLAHDDGAPDELLGYGPVADFLAHQLRGDRHTRVVPASRPRPTACDHASHPTYQPSPQLTRSVLARDRTCRFPGCRQPAHRCDVDHTVPHPAGPTCACNLGVLCRFHHRLKHQTGWRVEQPVPGVFEWTSPTRHSYRVPSDDDGADAALGRHAAGPPAGPAPPPRPGAGG